MIFFLVENRAVYEVMWKNVEAGEAAGDNITRRLRFACRITKARTQTHTQNM